MRMTATFFAAVLLALGSTGPAIAADLKIGYVNFGQLIQQAPQSQEATQSLRDEFGPQQRELQSKQQELQELQEEVQKNQQAMSSDELQEKRRRIRDLTRDLRRGQEQLQEDFNIRRNEELQQVQSDMAQHVRDFGRENGYDMVVVEGVLYASDAVDITEDVVEHMKSIHQDG